MKQRITRKDVESLAEEQKRRLNELWTPALYDVAAAKVLRNVATDEYEEYEFVVGGIALYGTSVYLTDITAAKTEPDPRPETQNTGNETPTSQTGDFSAAIEVDTFPKDYTGFGNREDYERAFDGASGGMGNTSGDEYDEYSDEGSEEKESFEEEELEDNYQHPAVLIKTDCTPLLTIGNMIEILQKNNFGRYDFYLSACTNEISCVLGKGDPSWGDYSDYESAELCDVLWESVKALL